MSRFQCPSSHVATVRGGHYGIRQIQVCQVESRFGTQDACFYIDLLLICFIVLGAGSIFLPQEGIVAGAGCFIVGFGLVVLLFGDGFLFQ